MKLMMRFKTYKRWCYIFCALFLSLVATSCWITNARKMQSGIKTNCGSLVFGYLGMAPLTKHSSILMTRSQNTWEGILIHLSHWQFCLTVPSTTKKWLKWVSMLFFSLIWDIAFLSEPNLSCLIFKSWFQTVLGKSSVCSNVQIIFETFYVQSQLSNFLLANFPDIYIFYVVLENLWKFFTSNIKIHMDLIFFYFFISPNFLVH